MCVPRFIGPPTFLFRLRGRTMQGSNKGKRVLMWGLNINTAVWRFALPLFGPLDASVFHKRVDNYRSEPGHGVITFGSSDPA